MRRTSTSIALEMGRLLCCLFLLLGVTTELAIGARILAVLPVPGRSHQNMFQAILTTLAQRGHQVVNYSPFLLDRPVANLTEFHLKVDYIEKMFTKEMMMSLMENSPIAAAQFIWKQSSALLKDPLEKSDKMKELFNSNEKYDLVIIEPLFAQEALLGLGHKFKAPVICLQPFGSFSLMNKAAGNSLALAYIPDFSFSSSDHMSFYERLISSYSILKTLYTYYTQYLPTQDEYMRTVFKDPTMPPLVDMLHNISLFLSNAHPNVHFAQPYTPNIIPIGGIHMSKEPAPLPSDMKEFLDEAKDGVVYISMGSILPDQYLPKEYFNNFIRVFRRLPQRVLWKTNTNLEGLPKNVMTAKWMPQRSVLAHPNVVLFMTHGGMFGQHEAIYAGVPVVCTPYFGDQPMNAKFYEQRGIGLTLPFKTITEQTIYSAITTILNNPKYKENMQRLSRIYRDRPLSPADTLVFWVEYVLRHGGAQHLRPASATLTWYQLALLDVLAAVLAALTMVSLVLYLVMKKIFSLIRTKKLASATSSTKKKN